MDLKCLSRRELYSLVNRLKSEINCLKTDLLRFKLLSNRYQKYLDFLEEMNERNDRNINIENEFQKQITDLNAINGKNCFVSLNHLNINESNRLISQINANKKSNELNNSCNELSAEEVISDNESVGFECDLNSIIDSNDETIDERVCEENRDKNEEKTNKIIELNEITVSNSRVETSIETNIEDINGSEETFDKELIETNEQNLDLNQSENRVGCNGSNGSTTLSSNTINNSNYKLKINKVKLNSFINESKESETELSGNCIKVSTNKRPKRKFVCDYPECGHRTANEWDYKRHIKIHSKDTEIRELKCEMNECNKQFEDKYSLRIHHLREHPNHFEDVEWIQCSEKGLNCDFITKLREDLKEHMKTHALRRIPCTCPNCTNGKNTNANVKQHICHIPDCNKIYGKTSHLRAHLRSHTGERPFLCSRLSCGKRFSRSDQLQRHERTHTTDKRFFCTECMKPFGRSDHLTKHLKTHKRGEQSIVSNRRVETSIESIDKHINGSGSESNKELDINISEDINNSNYNLRKNIDRKVKFIINELNESETELSDNYINGSYESNEELSDNSIKISTNKKQKGSNKSESSGERFKCDWSGCSATYLRVEGLRKHQNIHKGKYVCDECDKPFLDTSVLREHKQKVHKTSFKVFECDFDGCGHRVHSLRVLWIHKQMHSNESDIKCKINECNKQFENRNALLNHQLREHPNQLNDFEWFECTEDNCNFRTKFKKSFQEHMNIHRARFLCDWEGCDFRTISICHLNIHKLKHSDERLFKCEINDCNKLFKSESQLRSHQLAVHPQEFDDIDWMECSEIGCKYRTKSRSILRRHKNTHTKPNICNVCQKGFSRSRDLRQHMSIHTGNTDWKVQCEWYGCERLFKDSAKMRDHMNTHTAEVSHPCLWPHCDKTYINKTSLYIHMRRHKRLDYKCNWSGCEYQTTNSIRFKNHMNRHKSKENV